MPVFPSRFALRSASAPALASVLTAASLLTASSPAWACGGFFCSANTPVEQTAERIIFAQDGEGNVTQIVEVLYEGPADKFSWVLPVVGVPTPGVSSKQAFDRLQGATDPQYILSGFGSCYGGDGDGDSPTSTGTGGSSNSGGPVVTVLDSGSVGPFDYETISVTADDADPGTVAVEWLTANGYDPGPMAAEVLGPYLANGLNLIAFRLQKGTSTGSIRPISLEYKANAMAIPILPTAVAAADDMPVLVWILSDHRAVPTNYRSLEINELLIDWFNPTPTYDAVVSAAADEAGGQGFVTELSVEGADFQFLVAPTDDDIEGLFLFDGTLEDRITWLSSRLASFDGFLDVVREHLPLRANVTPDEFAACPSCYFYPSGTEDLGFGGAASAPVMIDESDPIYDTNMEAFEGALMNEVLQPLIDVGELLATHPQLTRLYTTMSASEMTKDPIFEQNPDLQDVSNLHTAQIDQSCEGSGSWVITLPDGTKVYGSGNDWPYDLTNSELPVNARVLQYSSTGAPDIVTDNRASILSLHRPTPAGRAPLPGTVFYPTESDGSSKRTKDRGCQLGLGPSSTQMLLFTMLGAASVLWSRRRRRS